MGRVHGVYLIINHIWRAFFSKKIEQNYVKIFLKRLFIFFLVSLAWVFFRTVSFQDAINYYKSIFCLNGIMLPKHYQEYLYDNNIIVDILNIEFGTTYAYAGFTQLIWLFLFFIFTIFSPNLKEIIIEKNIRRIFMFYKYFFTHSLFSGIIFGLIFLFIIIKLIIGNQGEFIYFQF